MNKIDKRIEEVLGVTLSRTIASTFRLMGIAEDELAAALENHPKKKAELDSVFKWLVPNELITSAGDELYRKHVRELIGRAIVGKKFGPATDAECLASLSHASKAAPLIRDYAATFGNLFVRLHPERADLAENLTESYPGAAKEIEADVRRKCTNLVGRLKARS